MSLLQIAERQRPFGPTDNIDYKQQGDACFLAALVVKRVRVA